MSEHGKAATGGARRWAVVLGVSAGTGAAVARAVAQPPDATQPGPGLDVFGVHRGHYPDLADALAADVTHAGRRVHLRRADAGTLDGAEAGAEELLAVAGPRSVSLLVHSIANASLGKLASGRADQLTPAKLHKTFDSMAHSFVFWTQALLARDLLAPGAHLLGLDNWIVDSVLRGTALISATKAALGAYVRHLAHELGPRGHRVNLLKFAGVMTSAVEKTFGAEHLEHLHATLRRLNNNARVCTTEEVGRFVAYLAGDGAAWFNGATIDFTGGEGQGLFDALMHKQREGEP